MYVRGTANTNNCINGKKIDNPTKCKDAGKSLGLDIDLERNTFIENLSGYPGGCYEAIISKTAWFNENPGNPRENMVPICIKGKTPSYH